MDTTTRQDTINKPDLQQKFMPINDTSYTQLAGHANYGEKGIRCIIPSIDGQTIIKLIQPPPRGQKELMFYRHLLSNQEVQAAIQSYDVFSDSGVSSNHDNECENPNNSTHHSPKEEIRKNSHAIQCLQQSIGGLIKQPELVEELVSSFIPKFHGLYNIDGYDYLEIERIGNKFKSASFTDIKIGKVTYDPNASEEKKRKSNAKWGPLPQFGYQFLGIKRGSEDLRNRSFGRSLTAENIKNGYDAFLPEEASLKKLVKERIVEKLSRLIGWFEKQRSFQFYGSSLLIAYCNETGEVDMKMIDFAHVFYEDMVDENYLFGIKKLREGFIKFG